MTGPDSSVQAQAELHHAYLLGLQLMIATRKDAQVMGDWMFRLFRRQHLEKFLSSFEKLGLTGLPDAVACARYHVMANSVGGVPVEYMEENDRKAWVRFRYPRWMYHGPTICGVPVEVSRGFLRGWYAHNGVSLGNPRLGYVCVSEDMTGEFGFCGYFREYDYDLTDDERLVFAKDERPPPFDPAQQPQLPADMWSEERQQKANRNYAMDYIRNGLPELAGVIGHEETIHLAGLAARLIGLQYYQQTAALVHAVDGDAADAARYLGSMFAGMGDEVSVSSASDGHQAIIRHGGLRIVRHMQGADRALVLGCWQELWKGAVGSHRLLKSTEVVETGSGLAWTITDEVDQH